MPDFKPGDTCLIPALVVGRDPRSGHLLCRPHDDGDGDQQPNVLVERWRAKPFDVMLGGDDGPFTVTKRLRSDLVVAEGVDEPARDWWQPLEAR